MDYDGNDFQGQNLQLAGEENPKFSPVLHPYALPKFDFDDSLHGHLRFDSLVENEVFLGIPSQEDNQWIEDFSRGNSGIEFSSSAAESCSISRHNNVWSEATSSESVEMLLKSVGQEEMVAGETIIEESDACDELSGLTERMEHHLKQDGKTKDVMDSKPALSPEERMEHVSKLNDGVCTSQPQEAEIPIHGSLHELDPNVSSEIHGIMVIESMSGVKNKCDEANQREHISVNESHDTTQPNDPSGLGMQIDYLDSSSLEAGVQVLDTWEPEHQVSENSFENANHLWVDTGKAAEEHRVFIKEADVDDQNLNINAVKTDKNNLENIPCSSSEAASTQQYAVESGISYDEPSSLVLAGAGEPHIAKGCGEDLRSTDPEKASQCEPVDLSNVAEIHQQFRESTHADLHVAFEGDNNPERHAIEDSNIKAEVPATSELKIDQATPEENSLVEGKTHLQESDHHSYNETSVSYSPGMDNQLLGGQGNGGGNNYEGDLSSSTELLGEKHTIQNINAADDAPGVPQKDSNAEVHASSPMVAGSMQTYGGNNVSKPNDVHYDQDVSFKEKENAKLPSPSSRMDCEIVEDMKQNNEIVHESECVTTARNEPASNVGFEKTNLASHDTVDGLPLLSEYGAPVDQVTDHLDETKRTENEGPKEPNLLSLKVSSQGVNELHPLLELEKDAPHSSACKLSHEDVDQSLTVETCSSASGTDLSIELLDKIDQSASTVKTYTARGSEQLLKANEASQNSSSKLEACPILYGSAVKEGNNSEGLLVPGNYEEAAMEKNHDVASLRVAGEGGSADSFKLDCGTPTTSCIVLSLTGKEKEGVKESMGDCVSLSEFAFHSSSQNLGRANTTKDESSFTVVALPSAGLSERETSKDGQSTIQPIFSPKIVEGSPSTLSVGLLDPKVPPSGGSKGTAERKTRRTSRATGKENAKRGKHKETTPSRQSDRGDKSCSVSVSLAGSGQLVQFEGLRPLGIVESSGTIPCVVSIPTSNLPDLNASSPPSALFRQPFTDLQQVELRAQIFVYGSLIQGAAPDEACMVSAFGASDGGRSVWEPVWRACMERIQGQKSHPNNPETPVQQRSESRYAGARPPDQSIKRGANKSKVAPSPLGQASSKGSPSPVVNSMIPLSSPLWNISTPDGFQSSGMQRTGLLDYPQPLPPLRPFQTPTTRGFVGHNASWLSQTPFPGPWVASSQTSAFDTNARFSLLPTTETVKLTPVKESSAPISSGTKLSSPSTLVHKEGPSIGETSSLSGMKEIAILPGQNCTDLKPRKRKKVTVSEDLGRNSLLSLTKTESVSAPVATSHLSTSVVVSTPTFFASKTDASKIVTAVTPTPFTDHPKSGEQNLEQKDIISDETFSKVEDAKRQAEDAAALAAGAVNYSQSVWSQLHKHKNSGLTPDAETKLASAAVAVAAAASVAKAAAAAAKIASNAALQAKLMADEALISSSRAGASSLPDMRNLGNTTAASILMGGNGGNCSSSVIVAAREAARRRVEAASAASKQAENLDAILKAAELAAEAVSQAGKIVAMGDPLPLNELVEAGPEGYWRIPQVLPKQGVIPNKDNREPAKADGIEDGHNTPDRHAKDGPSEEANTKNRGLPPLSREFSRESIESEVSKEPMEGHLRAGEGISGSFTTSLTDSRVKRSCRASDLAKTIGVVPESEIGSRSASITDQECEKVVGTVKESIKEGSLVEVCKDGDGFKTAWFSANVLSCKDGKAFVSYTELHSDEGMLREWVALEGEASSAPRVRIAHPMTTMQSEGARKRRRAAMGDYAWSVGDRVDVWMQNCWREGVVAEKNQKDDTTLTVHFPAEGEMSVAKVWHLRLTLIWKDGEWIEWSSLRGKIPSSQGDTPQEKRLKLGVLAIEGREKDKISKNIEVAESRKTDESQLLPLSGNEKVFNVGKSTGDQNKPNSLGTIRTGLQKEGSRVIVGVPKPGKKRKFMEVSKHYVAERSIRTNEPNDSVKFAKYLMPQGSGPRGWNNTKIVPKEKQVAESKTKSGKSQCVSGRTLIQKDTVLTSALSAQNDGVVVDHMSKDSGSGDENVSAQQGLMKFASFSNTEGGTEGPVLFSSRALPSDAPSKKTSTLNAKSERVDRGKLPPSGVRSGKVEVKEKFTSGDSGKSNLEVAEPRRSNRRIQPTSRLLEGLQSSLIISKIPAVPHDKSHRSQNRGTSKGKNHG